MKKRSRTKSSKSGNEKLEEEVKNQENRKREEGNTEKIQQRYSRVKSE